MHAEPFHNQIAFTSGVKKAMLSGPRSQATYADPESRVFNHPSVFWLKAITLSWYGLWAQLTQKLKRILLAVLPFL